MGQGILPFVFEAASQPMDLTARAGLTLVTEAMLALGLEQLVSTRLEVRRRRRGFSAFDKLHALILVQAAGGECVEDARVLARDAGFLRLIDRPWPSPDALHEFLLVFHDEGQMRNRPAEGAWIPDANGALQGLGEVNREVVHRIVAPTSARRATLDLDATVIESHKREARPHYKGGRGYQPTAVLWAEQDLVVADQYRDGNVPAGMHTPEVARCAVANLPAGVQERFFRGDSACYDEKLLKYLVREQIAFTISADMTADLRRVCTQAELVWTLLEDRPRETVEISEVVFAPGQWPKTASPLRYVALRIHPSQVSLFSDSSKYLAVVSNRWDLSAEDLVRWHWEKAGTIELLHDVTKNELAAGLPPSGKFGVNAAWYRINLLTYNLLTLLRRQALPGRFRQARPKRLRYEVFTVPAVIHSHARKLTARLGVPPLSAEELIAARGRLREFQESLRAALQP